MQHKKLVYLSLLLVPVLLYGLAKKKNPLEDIASWPSYHEAMLTKEPYKTPSTVKNNPRWQLLERLYEQNIHQTPHYSATPKIPKIIHQIWIDNPFPEAYKPLQQTVIKMHPDWQYKLWTNADLEEFKLENQTAFDTATNPGERADIWRYEILYRYGGLYLDSDFQCLKPFDTLHHLCDFYAGTDYYTREPLIYNGLIAAAPKNPIMRSCIDTLKAKTEDHQGLKLFFDIHKRTGPAHFTLNFFRLIDRYPGTAIIFPATFFYAWPSLDRDNNNPKHISSWIAPETFAIHHWGVSWLGGELPTH